MRGRAGPAWRPPYTAADSMANRAGPGRPRAGRANCPLLGAVAQPSVAGRIVEASLPHPRDFQKIIAAFAKMSIFTITIEFGADGMHLYGQAEPMPHSADTAALLVTIPASAMARYYCNSPPRLVAVSRPALGVLCENIAAGHQFANIFFCDDMKEMCLELCSAAARSTSRCIVSPAAAGRLPQEIAADLFDCVWQADSFREMPLTALPSGINETVAVRCSHSPSLRVELSTRAATPSASNTSTMFEPAGNLKADLFLHVEYLCAPFLATLALARAQSIAFHHGESLPLIVVGTPPASGTDLLSCCYFRIEAPLYRPLPL